MLKYRLTATALKFFSLNPTMRRAYRMLGNSFGARSRSQKKIPEHYIERVNTVLRLHREHGIPKHGDHILEIGTGWMHWEALACRLFFDVTGVLFDVWDNRQLVSLKSFVGQLGQNLDKLDADAAQLERARGLIAQIQQVADFDALYKLLGFQYVVDPDGTLTKLPAASFDFALSTNVMEHVYTQVAPQLIKDIATVLKPGGYSFQNIDLKDHLYYYDRTTSPKQYLTYSDAEWKRWFENDVQYFNRLQSPQWRTMFDDAGLTLVNEDVSNVDLAGLPIADLYQQYDHETLRCGNLALLHRKP
jgi:SAM-dependent methyltransferase